MKRIEKNMTNQQVQIPNTFGRSINKLVLILMKGEKNVCDVSKFTSSWCCSMGYFKNALGRIQKKKLCHYISGHQKKGHSFKGPINIVPEN